MNYDMNNDPFVLQRRINGFDMNQLLSKSKEADGTEHSFLRVSSQIAWFRNIFPMGRIRTSVIESFNENGVKGFTATARVYHDCHDEDDCYLSEGTAYRCLDPEKPFISAMEWAQTAAIGVALRNAGFSSLAETDYIGAPPMSDTSTEIFATQPFAEDYDMPLPSPQQATPVQSSPQQATPVQSSPQQAAPVQVAPQQMATVQSAPQQATPVQVAPQQMATVQSAPQQATPVQEPSKDMDYQEALGVVITTMKKWNGMTMQQILATDAGVLSWMAFKRGNLANRIDVAKEIQAAKIICQYADLVTA